MGGDVKYSDLGSLLQPVMCMEWSGGGVKSPDLRSTRTTSNEHCMGVVIQVRIWSGSKKINQSKEILCNQKALFLDLRSKSRPRSNSRFFYGRSFQRCGARSSVPLPGSRAESVSEGTAAGSRVCSDLSRWGSGNAALERMSWVCTLLKRIGKTYSLGDSHYWCCIWPAV